ncbi:MAG TPA: CvpA family protein [Candidatus Ozemobacteraceae bacterium]
MDEVARACFPKGDAPSSPVFSALLRLLILALLAAVAGSAWMIARERQDLNIFLGVLLGVFLVWFGLQGWRQGAAATLFGWIRLLGSFGAGYLLGPAAGETIGLGGLAASIAGFYLCAIVIFLLAGLAGKLLFAPDRKPGLFDRLAGLVSGAAEAVLLFALVAWGLSMQPPAWNKAAPARAMQLTEEVSRNLLAPLVPEQASGVVELVSLAKAAQGGIDPQKIDRQRLEAFIEPVRSHPKLRAVSDDAELRSLAQQKDFARLMRHPKITALMNDPEIQSLATNLDLHELSAILRPGIAR